MKKLASKLKHILEVLCDGSCHSLFELQTGIRLSEKQVRAVTAFLTEFGFAEMISNRELRIREDAKELFTQKY